MCVLPLAGSNPPTRGTPCDAVGPRGTHLQVRAVHRGALESCQALLASPHAALSDHAQLQLVALGASHTLSAQLEPAELASHAQPREPRSSSSTSAEAGGGSGGGSVAVVAAAATALPPKGEF